MYRVLSYDAEKKEWYIELITDNYEEAAALFLKNRKKNKITMIE